MTPHTAGAYMYVLYVHMCICAHTYTYTPVSVSVCACVCVGKSGAHAPDVYGSIPHPVSVDWRIHMSQILRFCDDVEWDASV